MISILRHTHTGYTRGAVRWLQTGLSLVVLSIACVLVTHTITATREATVDVAAAANATGEQATVKPCVVSLHARAQTIGTQRGCLLGPYIPLYGISYGHVLDAANQSYVAHGRAAHERTVGIGDRDPLDAARDKTSAHATLVVDKEMGAIHQTHLGGLRSMAWHFANGSYFLVKYVNADGLKNDDVMCRHATPAQRDALYVTDIRMPVPITLMGRISLCGRNVSDGPVFGNHTRTPAMADLARHQCSQQGGSRLFRLMPSDTGVPQRCGYQPAASFQLDAATGFMMWASLTTRSLGLDSDHYPDRVDMTRIGYYGFYEKRAPIPPMPEACWAHPLSVFL